MKTKILKFKPSNPFIDILPKIDVHGYTMDTIFVPVNDFINDNLKSYLKNNWIAIVSLIISGVLFLGLLNIISRQRRLSRIIFMLHCSM